MRIVDQMQRVIELDAPAKRIVSLVPSQTELLFAIGAGKSIVGATKFCTEPQEEASLVTKVGGTKQFDFRTIQSLNPDLIIGNKEENYEEGIDQLAEKYPVWMSDIVTLDDALQMIRAMGVLSGYLDTAEEMADTIANRFDGLQQFERAIDVAYLIWQKPYMVAGGDTFIDEMLKLGGMRNIFAAQSRYPEVNLETISDSKAEAILLSSEPFPFREKHLEAFRQAIPGKQIILVDAMPFSWYGSQLLRTPDYLRELRTKF